MLMVTPLLFSRYNPSRRVLTRLLYLIKVFSDIPHLIGKKSYISPNVIGNHTQRRAAGARKNPEGFAWQGATGHNLHDAKGCDPSLLFGPDGGCVHQGMDLSMNGDGAAGQFAGGEPGIFRISRRSMRISCLPELGSV